MTPGFRSALISVAERSLKRLDYFSDAGRGRKMCAYDSRLRGGLGWGLLHQTPCPWNRPHPGPPRRRGGRRALPFLRGGVEAGDAAERGRAADAVLAESARRIPAHVEAGDDLAVEVDDLRAGAHPDAGIGI